MTAIVEKVRTHIQAIPKNVLTEMFRIKEKIYPNTQEETANQLLLVK